VAIVKLRLESTNRSSPSVEFGNSLPRRWTRQKHVSKLRSEGLNSRRHILRSNGWRATESSTTGTKMGSRGHHT
jgi:hypothetical protein